ncbi:MAG: hypothetical protein KC621_15390, partial [Myxococcales bacterium]|nr:hypothetical protein [Myxococcales bacterium]
DEDGYGDPETYRDRCLAGSRNPIVLNAEDCDDTDPAISPLADEVCDRVDNDCDDLVDDFDPDIEPEGRRTFYADTDGDGYGDPNATALACWPTPGVAVANDRDCDDTDADANVPKAWVLDEDGDGVGVGQPTEFQCLRPGPQRAPYASGVDCAPLDPNVYPGAPDVCGDRLDTDCDGYDDCGTCKQLKDSTPGATSGVYGLSGPFGDVDVYCDMTTDGGGWTLVSSGRAPPDDAAGAWHPDLETLSPVTSVLTVWDGLREFAEDGVSDLRFTCKRNAADSSFAVDLSFYEVGWYTEITTGTDGDSCFNENNGVGQDPPPARRDNVGNQSLPAGDQWNYGYFEGEDTCTDTSDFTVDFDDRGMDSNQADGTDWGEDDGSWKCGTGSGASWFIFFRE